MNIFMCSQFFFFFSFTMQRELKSTSATSSVWTEGEFFVWIRLWTLGSFRLSAPRTIEPQMMFVNLTWWIIKVLRYLRDFAFFRNKTSLKIRNVLLRKRVKKLFRDRWYDRPQKAFEQCFSLVFSARARAGTQMFVTQQR